MNELINQYINKYSVPLPFLPTHSSFLACLNLHGPAWSFLSLCFFGLSRHTRGRELNARKTLLIAYTSD